MSKMRIELNEADISLEGQVEIFYYHSQKYCGSIFEMFNDYIASEFEVKDGLKNGIEKVYFNDGNIESISEYKNGLLDGVTKNYYETGELQEESFFEFGICVSHKIYSKDGRIQEEYAINSNSSELVTLKKINQIMV